jgi:hypothetical protein
VRGLGNVSSSLAGFVTEAILTQRYDNSNARS